MALKRTVIKGFRRGLGYPERTDEGYRDGTVVVDIFGRISLPGGESSTVVSGVGGGTDCVGATHDAAFLAVNNPTTGYVEVYRSEDGITGAKCSTWTSELGTEGAMLTAFANGTVLVYADDKAAVSYDSGESWTLLSGWQPYVDTDFHDGYYYFTVSAVQWELRRTRDFVNFETVAEFYADSDTYVACVGDFLFALHDDSWFRVLPDGELQSEPSLIGAWRWLEAGDVMVYASQKTADSDCYFYIFDGGEKRRLRSFSPGGQVDLLAADDSVVYFRIGDFAYRLMLDSGAIYYFGELPTGFDLSDPKMVFQGKLLTFLALSSPSRTVAYYQSGYITGTAYLTTGELDLLTHVPKRVVVRHDPLPADTSVEVLVRFDRESAFTPLIMNDVLGSISARYDFPNGSGPYEFVEFSVILETTDSSVSPSSVDLEYLFYPSDALK